MLTGYEARKLQHDMRQELHIAPVVLLKAAALPLLIIGLAWGGASSEAPANGDLLSRARLWMSAEQSYSKTVFEARRQHYVEAYPDSFVARDASTRAEADDSYYRYAEPRQPSWTEWLHAAGLKDVSARKYLFFTPRVLMQAAVAGGLGVGLTRSLLALDALAANKVAVPFGPVLAHPPTYNLVYARHNVKRKEVGTFREWLHAEAAASTKQIARMLKKFTQD